MCLGVPMTPDFFQNFPNKTVKVHGTFLIIKNLKLGQFVTRVWG